MRINATAPGGYGTTRVTVATPVVYSVGVTQPPPYNGKVEHPAPPAYGPPQYTQ